MKLVCGLRFQAQILLTSLSLTISRFFEASHSQNSTYTVFK